MDKKFKYSGLLPKACPPNIAIDKEFTGYRLIKQQTSTEQDFIPHALIYKKNKRYYPCNWWSLSFFDTEENAKIKYQSTKNLQKKYRYLAKVKVQENLGVSHGPSDKGHIDFWSYESTNFEDFKIQNVLEL